MGVKFVYFNVSWYYIPGVVFVFFVSSPLSSSLSIWGKDPPRQKSGMDADSGVVQWPEDAAPVESVLPDSLLMALKSVYLLLIMVFRVISSRRFIVLSGSRRGTAEFPFSSSARASSTAADAGKVKSSSGSRQMTRSTPTNRLWSNCGRSSASISIASGLSASLCGLRRR